MARKTTRIYKSINRAASRLYGAYFYNQEPEEPIMKENRLEKTEKILNLARNGKGLRKFVSETLPEIRKAMRDGSDRRDKHDDGFSINEDPCQSLVLRLCYKSFTGSFGDSSTYSDIASFDMNLWKVYLLKYLNAHKDVILLEMADMMVSDAKEQRDVAIDEIESMKASLKILLDDLV